MKIKVNDYARALIESAEKDAETKKVAKRFWYLLQHNKQHRDLRRILSALDQEYAKKHDILLGKIYSAKPMLEDEIAAVSRKVEARLGKKVSLELVVDEKLVAGVLIKVGDTEIDATSTGKINRLNRLLMSKS